MAINDIITEQFNDHAIIIGMDGNTNETMA